MEARLDLEWERHGTESLGSNPPIPTYECYLGSDQNSNCWYCRVKYRYQENKFLVAFDYDTEDEPAFLKDEVVYTIYQDDYWKAHKKVYHSKFVKYEDIQKVIREFVIENKIPVKDVTGNIVQ